MGPTGGNAGASSARVQIMGCDGRLRQGNLGGDLQAKMGSCGLISGEAAASVISWH